MGLSHPVAMLHLKLTDLQNLATIEGTVTEPLDKPSLNHVSITDIAMSNEQSPANSLLTGRLDPQGQLALL